jgi:hypothetical protein
MCGLQRLYFCRLSGGKYRDFAYLIFRLAENGKWNILGSFIDSLFFAQEDMKHKVKYFFNSGTWSKIEVPCPAESS